MTYYIGRDKGIHRPVKSGKEIVFVQTYYQKVFVLENGCRRLYNRLKKKL